MNWDNLVQYLVNGVTLGSVYALIALGYSMVYGILKLLNFAHGEIFMVGAFAAYGVEQAFGGATNPAISIWLVMVLMILTAMTASAAMGVAVERFAYRPLRTAPRIAPLISALGVSFFLQYSAQLLFGAQHKTYNAFVWGAGNAFIGPLFDPAKGLNVGPLHVSLLRLIIIALAIAMMIGLTLFIGRTKVGKAMRATSFDREAAAMMGIDVDRVIVVTFVIGSALAGAAGVMFGLRADVYPLMGFQTGLKAFTAAVIGGIGSMPGAMLGGLVLGIAESLTQGYVSTQWSDLVVFSILIAFMLVRPSGILGKADIRKV